MSLTTMFKSIFRFRDLLYLLLITTAGIFYSGYYLVQGDSHLYLTALNHRLNSNLYQNDYAVGALEAINTYSFFINIEILALKIFSNNLEYALFSLYFLSKFLLFYGIYLLSRAIFNNRAAAFAAIMITFLPLPLGGTIPTSETTLLPRMLALGPTLIYLSHLIKNKFIYAGLFFSIVALIHPITAFFLSFFGVMYILANRKKITKKDLIIPLTLITISITAMLIKQKLENNQYVIPIWSMSEEWKKFFDLKAHYLFLKYWKWKNWRNVLYQLIPLSTFILLSRPLTGINKGKLKIIKLFLLVPLILLTLNLIFVDFHLTPFFIRMESPRAIIFWFYFGFIGYAGAVTVSSLRPDFSPLSLYFGLVSLLALPRMHPAGFLFWLVLWLISLKIKPKSKLAITLILIIAMVLTRLITPMLFQPAWFPVVGLPILAMVYINNQLSRGIKFIIVEAITVVTVISVSLYLFVNHIKSNFPPQSFYGGINKNKIYWREYLQSKVYFPNLPQIDWFKAQLWAKENTPVSSVFLVPSYTQPGDHVGFRALSQRSIAYSSRDSGMGTISENYAIEWIKRYFDLEGNEKFDENRLFELQKEYKFDYVLRSKIVDPPLNFPTAYENDTIRVYRLPQKLNSL